MLAKKYFYIFLSILVFHMGFVNASIEKYITPQKAGDLVNLVITTVIPYSIRAYKLSTKNLSLKEYVKKLFSLKMVSYLGSMFLAQMFLWQYGSPLVENYFSPTEFSSTSTTAWILFGGLVGITSLKVGTFISAKVKDFFKNR